MFTHACPLQETVSYNGLSLAKFWKFLPYYVAVLFEHLNTWTLIENTFSVFRRLEIEHLNT